MYKYLYIVLISISYISNSQTINVVYYYDNGNISEEGSYVDNRKTGEWISYWSNGEIRSKGSYDEEHNQIGEWFYHREDGTVSEVKDFSEDEQEKMEEITNKIIEYLNILVDKKLDLFSSTVNNK